MVSYTSGRVGRAWFVFVFLLRVGWSFSSVDWLAWLVWVMAGSPGSWGLDKSNDRTFTGWGDPAVDAGNSK